MQGLVEELDMLKQKLCIAEFNDELDTAEFIKERIYEIIVALDSPEGHRALYDHARLNMYETGWE